MGLEELIGVLKLGKRAQPNALTLLNPAAGEISGLRFGGDDRVIPPLPA
jgi:hypothetical protein